ncbi:uncharacterized protein VICG_01922 [Vittaforma corneae ATCC 50505]|uniref:Uncharacterized protein n=1 Tax=Vittaforma corneae (strain ATCC 50505) TaxID=993615 RepID=L2GKK8_VITCO|nr:uncharacterized protein VICG_01922 [Vittaforma corneae ATCC 50505]ELA41040.1 hypothetical protein VICG_01922 [Vittaforma corneae ATCC 50505]
MIKLACSRLTLVLNFLSATSIPRNVTQTFSPSAGGYEGRRSCYTGDYSGRCAMDDFENGETSWNMIQTVEDVHPHLGISSLSDQCSYNEATTSNNHNATVSQEDRSRYSSNAYNGTTELSIRYSDSDLFGKASEHNTESVANYLPSYGRSTELVLHAQPIKSKECTALSVFPVAQAGNQSRTSVAFPVEDGDPDNHIMSRSSPLLGFSKDIMPGKSENSTLFGTCSVIDEKQNLHPSQLETDRAVILRNSTVSQTEPALKQDASYLYETVEVVRKWYETLTTEVSRLVNETLNPHIADQKTISGSPIITDILTCVTVAGITFTIAFLIYCYTSKYSNISTTNANAKGLFYISFFTGIRLIATLCFGGYSSINAPLVGLYTTTGLSLHHYILIDILLLVSVLTTYLCLSDGISKYHNVNKGFMFYATLISSLTMMATVVALLQTYPMNAIILPYIAITTSLVPFMIKLMPRLRAIKRYEQ